jgi:hypothetical protein
MYFPRRSNLERLCSSEEFIYDLINILNTSQTCVWLIGILPGANSSGEAEGGGKRGRNH